MASSISAGATSRRLRRRATVTGRERALYTIRKEMRQLLCAVPWFGTWKKREEAAVQTRLSLSLSLSAFLCVCLSVCQCYRRVLRRYSQDSQRPHLHTFSFFKKKKKKTFSSLFIYFFFLEGRKHRPCSCAWVSRKFFPLFFFFVYFLNLFECARKSSWRDVKIFFWKFFCCVSNPLPPLEKYNSGRRQKLFLFRVREYWTITGVTQRERKLCFFFLFPSGWRLSKLLKEIKSKDG